MAFLLSSLVKTYYMKILSGRLVAVQLIQRIKTMSISEVTEPWALEPVFTLGFNDAGKTIQNVEYTIIRQKNNKQATIKTMTSFELNLATKEYKPTTPQDFEAYTLFSQVAVAHSRAYFLLEARGSIFEGDLIPFEFNEHQTIKLKAGLSGFITPN